MTVTELNAIVTAHATSALGYVRVELTHWHFFANATICLVLATSRYSRTTTHKFGMIVEPDGTIQDDDLPEYKYWAALRAGKITWDR